MRNDVFNMSWAWDNEKIWVPTGIEPVTYSIPVRCSKHWATKDSWQAVPYTLGSCMTCLLHTGWISVQCRNCHVCDKIKMITFKLIFISWDITKENSDMWIFTRSECQLMSSTNEQFKLQIHVANTLRNKYNLRKQLTFHDTTNSFLAKWCLKNEQRNSILMMHHYAALPVKCLLISRKFSSSNQKLQPDLDSYQYEITKQGLPDHYTFLGNCPPTPPLSQH